MTTFVATTVFIPSPHANINPSALHDSFIQLLQSITPAIKSCYRTLSDSKSLSVFEILFQTSSPVDLVSLGRHPQIKEFEVLNNIQLAFQRDHVNRRYKRLAVFDMDSTL